MLRSSCGLLFFIYSIMLLDEETGGHMVMHASGAKTSEVGNDDR